MIAWRHLFLRRRRDLGLAFSTIRGERFLYRALFVGLGPLGFSIAHARNR